MMNFKFVEVYAVLLVLCTALILFGLFQMQAVLANVLGQAEVSPLDAIMQGVQAAAVGLVLSVVMLLLFFRWMQKRGKQLGNPNRKNKKGV